jgi:hypothetical protein
MRNVTGHNPKQPKVVIYIDTSTIDLFLNWFIFYCNAIKSTDQQKIESNLIVICMDTNSERELKSLFNMECKTYILPKSSSLNLKQSHSHNTLKNRKQALKLRELHRVEKLGNVWLQRIKILHELFINVYHDDSFILSDVDALWLRSPLHDIEMFSTHSGTVFVSFFEIVSYFFHVQFMRLNRYYCFSGLLAKRTIRPMGCLSMYGIYIL